MSSVLTIDIMFYATWRTLDSDRNASLFDSLLGTLLAIDTRECWQFRKGGAICVSPDGEASPTSGFPTD